MSTDRRVRPIGTLKTEGRTYSFASFLKVLPKIEAKWKEVTSRA
jgi:hypothetical protein